MEVNLNILEIKEKIAKKEISSREIFSFYSKRIEKFNPKLNALIKVFSFSGEEKSLEAVPMAVKDNICVKGKEITCASKILKGHISAYDATVIKRLKERGFFPLGVANMDEFAFGSSCETSCYGPAKNPWDTSKVPGGSSGGSAAAVAARLVPFALGSDTGGSIRQPASFCGVVGFKPTYGRVSRFGLIAFGSSLDQIGPITTNFVDAAYLLNIICGFDENDSTTAKKEAEDFTKYLNDDIKGLKVGIPQEYYPEQLNPQVKAALEEVKAFLEKKGAKLINIKLAHTQYAVPTYYIVATAEASSNLQRFDGIKYGLRIEEKDLTSLYKKTRREGFGQEAKRRIFLGTYSLSSGYYDAYYLRALKVRRLIKNDFDTAFKEVDVILTPTSPTPAFNIGEKIDDPLSMYLSDIFTISANLAGVPAVSFPCGFSKGNLPIGAQLIGPHFSEGVLIRTGFAYQRNTTWHNIIPEFKGS